jgi:hypothetical protein
MTRNRQIQKALELLAPAANRRAECRQDTEAALNWIERHTSTARSFRVAGSKKGKAGVERYRAALRRLRLAYDGLDPAIRSWFSLAETAHVAGVPTVIDREIVRTDGFLERPSPSPRRDAFRNKEAVARARDLLNWWGHEATISRTGKWMRLSQILLGDRTVDVFDHLRDRRHRGPGIAKVLMRGGTLYLFRKW